MCVYKERRLITKNDESAQDKNKGEMPIDQVKSNKESKSFLSVN